MSTLDAVINQKSYRDCKLQRSNHIQHSCRDTGTKTPSVLCANANLVPHFTLSTVLQSSIENIC